MTHETFFFPKLHHLKLDFAASGWKRDTSSCPHLPMKQQMATSRRKLEGPSVR